MVAQGNSGDGSKVRLLREIRAMLNDPENGAVAFLHVEECVKNASLRGHTYSATVLSIMQRFLSTYRANLKRDGSSSAGATRVVGAGPSTRSQDGAPAAEERVHDPDGVSDMNQVQQHLIDVEGRKAAQVTEAAAALLLAVRDALTNSNYGLKATIKPLAWISEDRHEDAYSLLDDIFRTLGPLEVMNNGLTSLIAMDIRHVWPYGARLSTAKLEDLSKTMAARLDVLLAGVSVPVMRARARTLQILSYLKSERYKKRPGHEESSRAAQDAKAGIIAVVANPRMSEAELDALVHSFTDHAKVTFVTHRFSRSSGLEDDGTAMAAGDGGGGGGGGAGGGGGRPGGANGNGGGGGRPGGARSGGGNADTSNNGASGSGAAGGSKGKGKGKAKKNRSDIQCFKCGKMGHFANDCPAA